MATQLEAFRNHCRRMADSKPTDRLLLHVDGRAEQRMAVGQIPDAERALWSQLAGEIDAFLTRDEDRAPGPDDEPLEGM